MSDPKLDAQCAIRKAMRRRGGPPSPLSADREAEIIRWRLITFDVVHRGYTAAQLASKHTIALSTARKYVTRARAGWISTAKPKRDPLLD